MIIPRKEFTFFVLAAEEQHQCLYLNCHKSGEFHIGAKNDRDQYICDFPNCCDMHIIHVFIEVLAELE